MTAIDNCGRLAKLVSSNGAIALFAEMTETSAGDHDTPRGDIWLIENFETRKVVKVRGLVDMAISGGRVENASDVDWRSVEPVLVVLTKTELLVWKGSYPFFEPRRIQFQTPPPNLLPINSVALSDSGTTLLIAANDGQAQRSASD